MYIIHSSTMWHHTSLAEMMDELLNSFCLACYAFELSSFIQLLLLGPYSLTIFRE